MLCKSLTFGHEEPKKVCFLPACLQLCRDRASRVPFRYIGHTRWAILASRDV